MGNHTCTCILGSNKDLSTFKLEPDSYIISHQCVQMETNLLNEQEGGEENKKSKSIPTSLPYAETLDESTCPGVLLKADTFMTRVNEKVLKREKELVPFEIDASKENSLDKNKKIISILYPDNSIYQGCFENKWVRNGFGSLLLNDGSKYIGFFVDDKMKGKGRLIYSDGDYYEGLFDDDKPNGPGLLVKYQEGASRYCGEFKDGLKDGMGIEHLPDGSVYEGLFVNDYKNGKGKFTWPDETVFEGHFKQNDIEGLGRIIYPESKVYLGNWKSNKIEGKGIFFWQDGRLYIGNYHAEKKNGFGIFLFNNGKRYEGYWLQGKQHGVGICYLKGVGRLGEWRFGKKIRWLCMDISVNEDPVVKANVSEIKKKAEELVMYIREKKLPHYEEEYIKDKLLAYKIQ
jgi:hypothetical protein